jgi:hypothetical protein
VTNLISDKRQAKAYCSITRYTVIHHGVSTDWQHRDNCTELRWHIHTNVCLQH